MSKNDYNLFVFLGETKKNCAQFRFQEIKIAGFVLERLNIYICCQTASWNIISLVVLLAIICYSWHNWQHKRFSSCLLTACTGAKNCCRYCVVPSVEAAVPGMSSFSPPLSLSPYLVVFATAECGNERYWCSVNNFKIIFCSRRWRREF
jgi:hypothetical protein